MRTNNRRGSVLLTVFIVTCGGVLVAAGLVGLIPIRGLLRIGRR